MLSIDAPYIYALSIYSLPIYALRIYALSINTSSICAFSTWNVIQFFGAYILYIIFFLFVFLYIAPTILCFHFAWVDRSHVRFASWSSVYLSSSTNRENSRFVYTFYYCEFFPASMDKFSCHIKFQRKESW